DRDGLSLHERADAAEQIKTAVISSADCLWRIGFAGSDGNFGIGHGSIRGPQDGMTKSGEREWSTCRGKRSAAKKSATTANVRLHSISKHPSASSCNPDLGRAAECSRPTSKGFYRRSRRTRRRTRKTRRTLEGSSAMLGV